MSRGYTPQEAYDAVPQLRLQAKKDNIMANLRKHRRGMERAAAPSAAKPACETVSTLPLVVLDRFVYLRRITWLSIFGGS